jgi:hypothetical protein
MFWFGVAAFDPKRMLCRAEPPKAILPVSKWVIQWRKALRGFRPTNTPYGLKDRKTDDI